MKEIMKPNNIKLLKNDVKKSSEPMPFPFDIQECKKSFVTRNVNLDDIKTLLTENIKPQAGDLVIAEVTRLRQHCRIEFPNGRRSRMFVKDKILVSYGNRYAPDQFEAIVPDDLSPCHLVAGGGIAAKMRYKSQSVKPATEIKPLGLVGDKDGKVINLSRYNQLKKSQHSDVGIPVIVVAGSSMNAGKTTTVASLVKGLSADGYKVAAAKITGTGSGCDLWHFLDAGANVAIDFTDAGYATTYKVHSDDICKIFEQTLHHLQTNNPDMIVIEVADGILQEETADFLKSETAKSMTTAMVFTAGDSCSAIYGLKWLEELEYNVIGISGVVSGNPLGSQEVSKLTDVPVITKKEMISAGFGHKIYESILNRELKQLTAE